MTIALPLVPERNHGTNYRCFQNYYHALQYLRPQPKYILNVRSSVNHWQLRDLVQIDDNGALYHTYDDLIRTLLLVPQEAEQLESQDMWRLPYFPRCFHARTGAVVAGGVVTSLSKVYLMNIEDLTRSHTRPLKGLFSVHVPQFEATFKLGEMINNAVTIYENGPGYTLYVCNNDLGLYVVDVGKSSVTTTCSFVCEQNTSLNNVQKAPDGLLTITGDSGSIFIADPRVANATVDRIPTCHDSGFGISHHTNGHVVAAAFQDGTCLLYDMRNRTEPLREVLSTRAGHNSGAFRTCKFLRLPVHDLLVVLEHVGRVHVVDLRANDTHLVIVFPFALDQFARHRHERLSVREKFTKRLRDADDTNRVDTHRRFDVYGDTAAFPAPLVYDAEYLTDTNPKLFKDYEYHALVPVAEPEQSPRWSLAPVSVQECDNGPYMYDMEEGTPQEERHGVRETLNLDAPEPYHLQFCHDSYQQLVNHTNGEMELAGVDWFENQLYIGCEDGGILAWDINVKARRSFGSFSYA